MARETIDKFINSSLSIVFLTLTAFSTAYCYCWGQALFHGLPWWHVEIGNGIMARSLAWVFCSSLILLFSYASGGYVLNKISQKFSFPPISCLRVWFLVSVFSTPVLLTFYLFIGKIPSSVVLFYLVLLILCLAFFRKKWGNVNLQLDYRKWFVGERFLLFMVFLFVYFSLLSLCIGYLRSGVRQTYDYIEIEGKQYYILANNGEKGYIMGERTRGNDEFLFFNRDNREYYKVHVVHVNK